MRPDDDDFAAIVVAQQFELLYPDGIAAADFQAPITAGLGTFDGGLAFHHGDTPNVGDSALIWTRHQPTAEQLTMFGPVVSSGTVYTTLELFGNSAFPGTVVAELLAVDGSGTTNGFVALTDGSGSPSRQASVSSDVVGLNPRIGLRLNGRPVYGMVATDELILGANVAPGVALAPVAGFTTAPNVKSGDILMVTGFVDVIWNAFGTIVVYPSVGGGGFNIGGAGVATTGAVGDRNSVPFVGRFAVSSTGALTIQVWAQASAAGVVTIQGGGNTSAYTYTLFGTT